MNHLMEVEETYQEIKELLLENAQEPTRMFVKKMVPSTQFVYGVKMPLLNEVAKHYKNEAFDLAPLLWQKGALEEKLLAAKLLGKASLKNPQKTFEFIHQFVDKIEDWAVCDTLAVQTLRPLHKKFKQEIFDLSKKYIKSDNFWKIRFGIVMLQPFCKQKENRDEIKKIIQPILKNKEYYVKKAMQWLDRELNK